MLRREELELLRWRVNFIGYVVAGALLVLAFGFWNAQIVQVSYYQQKAEQNRVREIPLLERGGCRRAVSPRLRVVLGRFFAHRYPTC